LRGRIRPDIVTWGNREGEKEELEGARKPAPGGSLGCHFFKTACIVIKGGKPEVGVLMDSTERMIMGSDGGIAVLRLPIPKRKAY